MKVVIRLIGFMPVILKSRAETSPKKEITRMTGNKAAKVADGRWGHCRQD